jgi:protein-arginine kinase activator protein McsA
MEKENWIKWLQARIPELKKSHNEFWISQALDGYLKDQQKKDLDNSTTSRLTACSNCNEMVEMIITEEKMCPRCFC